MDRRKSLKVMALGAVSGGLLLDACKGTDTDKKVVPAAKEGELTYDRTDEEKAEHERLMTQTFFTEHEMATIGVLSNIIIPADEVSGSATDAGVPAFIEFMAKDRPEFQTPLRGGLRWLDIQMARLYGKAFKDCTGQEQLAMADALAYPNKAKPGMQQGVKFFTLMRNLTASGFYSSEIGMKDIGYAGNRPNQWNGVPDDVLKQYNIAYTEKELKECISFPSKPA